MRIIILSFGFPPDQIGGAEMHSLRVATALKKIGHSVTIISGEMNEDESEIDCFVVHEDEYESLRIQRCRLRTANMTRYSRHQELRNWADNFFFRFDFDALYVGLPWYLVSVVESAQELEIPFVYYAHGYELACLQCNLQKNERIKCFLPQLRNECLRCRAGWKSMPNRMLLVIIDLAIRLGLKSLFPSDRLFFLVRIIDEYREMLIWKNFITQNSRIIFCPSEYTLKQLRSALDKDTMLMHVPNGIDLRRFQSRHKIQSSAHRGNVRLVYVGRLDPMKGLDIAIEAIRSLPKEVPIEFKIYGALTKSHYPEYISHLERLCRNEIRANLCGIADPKDVPGIYSKADALLLPTLTDTLSTQIQEALASGIPCICSNVDGNPEMIQHGKNGLLFDPCDPITVKEQIREFVENQELRHRLRLNAKPLWDSNLVAEKFLMHV